MNTFLSKCLGLALVFNLIPTLAWTSVQEDWEAIEPHHTRSDLWQSRRADGIHLNQGKMGEGYKICWTGDTGMHLLPTQYWVATALAREKCDQIRILGDIIYPKGIKSKKSFLIFTGFILPYARLLLQKIPFYLALGNHDYKGNPDAWIDYAEDKDRVNAPRIDQRVLSTHLLNSPSV